MDIAFRISCIKHGDTFFFFIHITTSTICIVSNFNFKLVCAILAYEVHIIFLIQFLIKFTSRFGFLAWNDVIVFIKSWIKTHLLFFTAFLFNFLIRFLILIIVLFEFTY